MSIPHRFHATETPVAGASPRDKMRGFCRQKEYDMRIRLTSLHMALTFAVALLLATSAGAGHHEAPEAAADAMATATDAATSDMAEKAKRAGKKGATTGADSMMKGSTVQDSAKKGGAAAVDEVMKSSVPAMPKLPGAVSAPVPE